METTEITQIEAVSDVGSKSPNKEAQGPHT
jgi:hypothetical protein